MQTALHEAGQGRPVQFVAQLALPDGKSMAVDFFVRQIRDALGQVRFLIREIHPDIRVLFCSGYTGNGIEHHGIIENDLHFLQKPFTSASLAREVRETLDRA